MLLNIIPELAGREKPERQRALATHDGMAFFAGTGPSLTWCEICRFWSAAGAKPQAQARCQKFSALMSGKVSPKVPGRAASCNTSSAAMASLPALIAGRLGQLIPRLASDFGGEVVATARAIRRTLAGQRLDLHDLVRAIATPTRPTPDPAPMWVFAWSRKVKFARRNVHRLREREAEFVLTIAHWVGPPPEKQRSWLEAIVNKL